VVANGTSLLTGERVPALAPVNFVCIGMLPLTLHWLIWTDTRILRRLLLTYELHYVLGNWLFALLVVPRMSPSNGVSLLIQLPVFSMISGFFSDAVVLQSRTLTRVHIFTTLASGVFAASYLGGACP
jgi:hypothetical protein